MKEVDSSYVLEGDQEEILAHLSPTRVAEYMNYTVRETTEGEVGQRLRVRKYDTEFTLAVQETANGYEFSQYGSEGPFQILEGDLRIKSAGNVTEEAASRVTVEITYTIGSLLAFLVDWLARRIVKRDAQSLLDNLATSFVDEKARAMEDASDDVARE